jgi:hypothetical protein
MNGDKSVIKEIHELFKLAAQYYEPLAKLASIFSYG